MSDFVSVGMSPDRELFVARSRVAMEASGADTESCAFGQMLTKTSSPADVPRSKGTVQAGRDTPLPSNVRRTGHLESQSILRNPGPPNETTDLPPDRVNPIRRPRAPAAPATSSEPGSCSCLPSPTDAQMPSAHNGCTRNGCTRSSEILEWTKASIACREMLAWSLLRMTTPWRS